MNLNAASQEFCRKLEIEAPIICGAMYPCSNPELVAAVSEAGGIGIVQPLSLTYVYGYDFREGLRFIRTKTKKPIGLNLLVEASSDLYLRRMNSFLEIALEEGVRFFITALGKVDWVVEKTKSKGALVYHDVTRRHWAEKALKSGVDGFIAVNNEAGGHSGELGPKELLEELRSLGKPVVCAGGVGNPTRFQQMLDLGYVGVQMGTRFIATEECAASTAYKEAILKAEAKDIMLTERLTGVPVSVIRTPHMDAVGYKASGLLKFMLKHPKLKHWARTYYSLKSFRGLKASIQRPNFYKDILQAGKSVEDIDQIVSVRELMQKFRA